MTLKRKSNARDAIDPESVKRPRTETDGDRSMTEKEKRKAARMVRNRHSAQASRDKKREYLEGLEATIATLQAENKDLKDRMINQNSSSIVNGGHYVLPLSPDPSSIAIPAKQEHDDTPRHYSPSNGDDSEDEDDDDEGSLAIDRESSRSMEPARQASLAASSQPPQTSPPSSEYTQALVALATENASLRNRLVKLEKVVQVLLGMNSGVPTSGPASATGLDILSLLGPDQPEAHVPTTDFRILDPSTNLPPQVSPFDISPGLPQTTISSTLQPLPTDFMSSGPAFPSPSTSAPLSTFPTTENRDHARHPAAMTTNPELPQAPSSALQRACFYSLVPTAKEARERETKEMKLKVVSGLKRVLKWRTKCLLEQKQEERVFLESTTMISSAA